VATEFSGGGIDTLQSAVLSLNLAQTKFANIENAVLTGSLALSLTGSSGANTLTGNAGANLIDGNGGGDTMIGGGGNDTYIIRSFFDEVLETPAGGTDTVESSSLGLSLADYANVENARLTGSANLALTGDNFGNSLTGNSGNNVIHGRGGADKLTGGAGADDFVYTSATDSTLTQRDVISDFVAGVDDIDISALAGTYIFRGTQAFSGGQQVRFVQNASSNTTTVEIDTGGAIGADMAITLIGLINLTASDFILI
jgi:Ca2+-binding RTX toxin-like protein